MAAHTAAHVLSKGPLASALGQWTLLGVGTFVLFTGDNGVSRAAQEIAAVAVRLVAGRDGSALWREAALGRAAANSLHNQGTAQPIVIHSVSTESKGNYGGWTTTIVHVGLASGACWTAYVLFSNFLPDQIKELLPVTRKFFEGAVTSLGQGILKVREALEEKIKLLGLKQDQLGEKQDQTHSEVLGLKDDIGDVRLNIDDIAVAISRCEDSLTDAAGRQTYMSRGVRLLVQCVGDLLRPSNPTVAEELDQFSRLSSEMMDGEFHYRDANGGRTGALIAKECPSSPNLSEIGSTTSMDHLGDHHHHHHHHHGSRSVPRPRRPQPALTHSTTNVIPSSASKATNRPPHLPGIMASPPGKLRMLHSFGGGTRGSDATTATTASMSTMSRSLSSPPLECEVPRSNYYHDSNPSSGQATPTALGEGVVDPVPKEELEVLLRRVERGGISPVASPAPAMRAH